MADQNNWFSIHRKLMSSELWLAEPFTRGQAWVDLIALARFQDGFIRKRGIRISIKRGQVPYSENELSKRWNWSRGKTARFLKELENEQQIEQQKNNITTLITIINYNKYQCGGQQNEQQTDNRRTTELPKRPNDDGFRAPNNDNNEIIGFKRPFKKRLNQSNKRKPLTDEDLVKLTK